MIATVAPHASGDKGDDDQDQERVPGGDGNAPIPAKRHENLFGNVNVSRATSNFGRSRGKVKRILNTKTFIIGAGFRHSRLLTIL